MQKATIEASRGFDSAHRPNASTLLGAPRKAKGKGAEQGNLL